MKLSDQRLEEIRSWLSGEGTPDARVKQDEYASIVHELTQLRLRVSAKRPLEHVDLSHCRALRQGPRMSTLKPFNLDDIDESLTRIVTHGPDRYVMFPYINGMGAVPAFNSISQVIRGQAATVEDFAALTALAKKHGEAGAWFISFSTPWLIRREEAEELGSRRTGGGRNRH